MKNVRLNLEVPAQSKETSGSSSGSSAFVRVGVIALLGFGVGVAWPRAAAVRRNAR